MRLHAIVEESIVDGPGLRFVVFTQGCPHNCPGCHNPQTHDPDGGYEISSEELIAKFERLSAQNPLLDGVTLSGGEPLLHARELLPFAKAVRGMGFDIWLYSGYTLEEIVLRGNEDEMALLENVATLVDGRFERKRKTLDLPFVGSSNQRIIDAPAERAKDVRGERDHDD